MSDFNAMPRPATILVTGNRAAVIRRRETLEDVFGRDVLSAHLSGGTATDGAVQAGRADAAAPAE